MFEKYGFHGVFIAIQAVLTLYAQGIYCFHKFLCWHSLLNINKRKDEYVLAEFVVYSGSHIQIPFMSCPVLSA